MAIILGGVLRAPNPPSRTVDYADSIDRVFEGARLYREGRIANVLVCGGNPPWQAGIPEAVLIQAAMLNPNDWTILSSLGQAYFALDAPELALATLERPVALNGESAALLSLMGEF